MKFIFILLFFIQVHAHGPIGLRDPEGLFIEFQPFGFQGTRKNSEYFFEVTLRTNYGLKNVEIKMQRDLSRMLELREEIGAGRLHGAPLEHWFYRPEGGLDVKAKLRFQQKLENKISSLVELLKLNKELKNATPLFFLSDSISGNETWETVRTSLEQVYQHFRIRELVERANEVSPLPELEPLIGRPFFIPRRDAIDRVTIEPPRMQWNLKIYRKDPGAKPIVVQDTTVSSDVRVPVNDVYAHFLGRLKTEEESFPMDILVAVKGQIARRCSGATAAAARH